MMDTYSQPITLKRQYRGLEEKRRIVEESLVAGASVALVARAHGVNANQVFNWRKLYQAGQLGGDGAKLLPVKVTSESLALTAGSGSSLPSSRGTIHIQLRHAQVSVEGNVDPGLLRVLLECLQR
jgi:transposase